MLLTWHFQAFHDLRRVMNYPMDPSQPDWQLVSLPEISLSSSLPSVEVDHASECDNRFEYPCMSHEIPWH